MKYFGKSSKEHQGHASSRDSIVFQDLIVLETYAKIWTDSDNAEKIEPMVIDDDNDTLRGNFIRNDNNDNSIVTRNPDQVMLNFAPSEALISD